jgi:diguanylate cyclase (GGDEF)-like protein
MGSSRHALLHGHPSMTDASVPLSMWFVALQLALYAAAWGACSLMLRESRAAIGHWGAFLLLLGLALAMGAGRGEPRAWLFYNGSNLLSLIGFALMRRGTERFLRVASSDREQVLVLLPVLAVIALAGLSENAAPLRIVAVYSGHAYCVLRAMWTIRQPLVREFGRPAAAATLVPGVMIGMVQVVMAALQVAQWPHAMEMQRDTATNLALMALYLVGGAVLNVGFMALLMMRLVAALREASQIDPLTGLYNRRAIRQALDHAWQVHRRSQQPLALLLVDIDHFKQINDGRGHAAGDQVLIGLAALLQRHARAVDLVGRIGGDECLLLLPGADEDQAAVLAERLRHQVEIGTLGVTVSIGAAQARRGDSSVDMTIARADQALYRAKSLGRNRVELAVPDAAAPGAQVINPAPAR